MNDKKKAVFLEHVPWDDIIETLDALAEAVWERDAALDLVAELIDRALPLDELVGGAAGEAMEAIDGPVLRAILGLLWTMATNQKARAARKVVRIQKLRLNAAALANAAARSA